MAALLGAVDRGRDVDAEAEVLFAHALEELLGGHRWLSNTAAQVVTSVRPIDHGLEIGRVVALPVGQSDSLACDGREGAAVPGIAKVDRLELQRDLEEPP